MAKSTLTWRDPSRPTRHDSRGAWHQHPLVIALLAAVIGGAFAVVAALIGQNNNVFYVPAGAVTTVTVTATPSVIPQAGSSQHPSAGAPIWGPKEVELGDIALDGQAPQTGGVISADLSLQAIDGTKGTFTQSRYGALEAAWTGPAEPSRQDCVDQTGSHYQARVVAAVNDYICVKTALGRIAVFKVTELDSSTSPISALLILTLWES